MQISSFYEGRFVAIISLLQLAQKYDPVLVRRELGLILTMDEEAQLQENGINIDIIPVWKYLLFLLPKHSIYAN